METYDPYGTYDHVVHEFKLLDAEGAAQPWDMEDAEDAAVYTEGNTSFSVTTDTSTSERTLTVVHTMMDNSVV